MFGHAIISRRLLENIEDCGQWAVESRDSAARLAFRQMATAGPALSSEPKCNTPADLIIGKVDQDLRGCCHAMLFAFVG